MAKGGKRIGAGRKKGFAALSAEEARRVFAEAVSKEIQPISAALIKKAKEGDISAIRELLDRAYGKATQPIDKSLKVSTVDLIRQRIDLDRRNFAS